MTPMSTVETEDTRKKILKAARQVFVEKGIDGARMQEIADRAGVNKALLHYYYSSKENLYQEIIQSVFMQFFENVTQIMNSSCPIEEQIRFFIEQHINFIEQNRDFLKLLGFEIMRENESFFDNFEQAIKKTFQFPERLVNLLLKGMDEGVIRKHNPRQTIISIVSMNVFFFFALPLFKKIFPGITKDDASFLEERKKAISDLLLYGILEPSQK
jgi:AcrR family transcriptional regulator